jgi:nucleoside-diphosphate-sugar epimerase
MHEIRRVLVTGGGGFLGSAVVKMLVARGDSVRSFSRRFHSRLAAWNVEQVQGDIGDPPAVTAAMRDIDVVFHTAAKAGVWGNYADFFRTNVTGTHNVIDGCRAAGVKALVYTSSPSVIFDGTDMQGVDESTPYPQKFSAHYPRTKALAEQAVLQAVRAGLKAVILRPHLIWGPEDPHFLPRILARAHRLRRIGDATKDVDTIYIDNAAEAHLAAADKLLHHPGLAGRIYFISQGDPMPLWDMIDAMLDAAGLQPVKGSVPPMLAWAMGALLEWGHRLLKLDGEPRMTRFVAKELATAHWFNIDAARRDLGYRPRVSTAEGLKRLSEWLRAEKPTDDESGR